MTRGYTKQDVDISYHQGHSGCPMVRVKADRFPDIDDVVDRFGCSERTAECALEFTFEMHQEGFWEHFQDKDELAYYFPNMGKLEVWSAGRSGGWLVVEGLGDVADWDAITLGYWQRFEKSVKAEVEYLCSKAVVFESIDANEWAMDKASLEGMMQDALT